MIAVVTGSQLGFVLFIVALWAGMFVFFATDLDGLIHGQRVDELWDDEVSEREVTSVPTGDLGCPSESILGGRKTQALIASRSLTSVDHRLASDKAGVGGDQARSSSSVSRGLTTDVGGCICNPRYPHMSDADCSEHGLAALCRRTLGVYDQETDDRYAHLHGLIDQVQA